MIKGIIKTPEGFSVKNFQTGELLEFIGNPSYKSYMDAVNGCRKYYAPDFCYDYLSSVPAMNIMPDADVWENLIYASDPRGVWDGERQIYRNVTSMDRGAATEDEIAYVDALDATYYSLIAMIKKNSSHHL